jgi:hypothetical protein
MTEREGEDYFCGSHCIFITLLEHFAGSKYMHKLSLKGILFTLVNVIHWTKSGFFWKI